MVDTQVEILLRILHRANFIKLMRTGQFPVQAWRGFAFQSLWSLAVTRLFVAFYLPWFGALNILNCRKTSLHRYSISVLIERSSKLPMKRKRWVSAERRILFTSQEWISAKRFGQEAHRRNRLLAKDILRNTCLYCIVSRKHLSSNLFDGVEESVLFYKEPGAWLSSCLPGFSIKPIYFCFTFRNTKVIVSSFFPRSWKQ